MAPTEPTYLAPSPVRFVPPDCSSARPLFSKLRHSLPDEASPQFYGAIVFELGVAPGHLLPAGPDHGAGMSAGVADRDIRTSPTTDYPLALDKKEDEAREAGDNALEGDISEARLVAAQLLAR